MKINLTIEKIQDSQATLKDDKGRSINWPADLLPAETEIGKKITFNIGEEGDLAKDVLNEILNTD
jgi:hypothetical protein